MSYEQAPDIAAILHDAQHIVILQADNPDADSLGSALALESIIGELGKTPYLYCAVDMPSYLRYLEGWDRVEKDIPHKVDASIIVDASTITLFEKLVQSGQQGGVAAKPCIVLDHHGSVDNLIAFATVTITDSARSSTGELIYVLAQQLSWPLSQTCQKFIMTSILGDTQGLSNQLATAETYRIMADLVDAGVNRPQLEEARRDLSKMTPEILHYKGELLSRAELSHDGHIANIVIPQTEITQYSPLYNPGPLVQSDLLQTLGVQVSIIFKHYADGKTTGTIRCNPGFPIGAQLAEQFGGGGHNYASGFKVTDGRLFADLKTACLHKAGELLDNLPDVTS